MTRKAGQAGFSLVEMLAMVLLIGVISVIALPSVFRTTEDMRLRGDGRAIAQLVGVAKMRAASRFSRARVYVDLDAQTYRLQVWDRAAAPPQWVTEGAITRLSRDVTFVADFGDLTPPPESQVVIAQSSQCTDGIPGNAIANTACIVFNSRGIPIDGIGQPVGDNAIYITNGVGVYATTITATPLVRLWWTPANTPAWVRQ